MTDFEKRRIFAEIDKIIEQCKNSHPTPYEESKFKKLYNKLKKEEGIEIEKD